MVRHTWGGLKEGSGKCLGINIHNPPPIQAIGILGSYLNLSLERKRVIFNWLLCFFDKDSRQIFSNQTSFLGLHFTSLNVRLHTDIDEQDKDKTERA